MPYLVKNEANKTLHITILKRVMCFLSILYIMKHSFYIHYVNLCDFTVMLDLVKGYRKYHNAYS